MDFDDYKYNNPINARCPTSHIQIGKGRTGSSNRHWLSRQTGSISSGVTGNSVAPAQMSFSLTWGSWAPSAVPLPLSSPPFCDFFLAPSSLLPSILPLSTGQVVRATLTFDVAAHPDGRPARPPGKCQAPRRPSLPLGMAQTIERVLFIGYEYPHQILTGCYF